MTQAALRDDLPKLEKYELCEEIGHGGMATVYRAKDLRLGREVAVKIIHRHLRENSEVATRFIAEARAAAKLKHRGIVEVYDVSGEEDRERFLVVELVKGVTLRKILQDRRDMPAEVGAAIVIELCDALEHAHESGIIHRDIKPENVLVGLAEKLPAEASSKRANFDEAKREPGPADSAGRSEAEPPASNPRDSQKKPTSARSPRSKAPSVILKITDFGIAKILDAQGVTSTGQVLGSPAHMAPEQIEGGEVDARTDVFALGVVLYECLVGHLPFDGKNPAQVLRRVLDGKYAPADQERPSVGGVFARIVDRALAGDLKDRPATPSALAELLRKELLSLGLGDPRGEIEKYFADERRYSEELRRNLVTALVTRAEEARRDKRTADAAVDFNRAHALAPEDLVILKRMTQLGRGAGSEKMQRRIAFVLAASLGLGGAAYFVARGLRADNGSKRLVPTTLAGRSVAPPFSRARVLASERRPYVAASVTLSSRPSAEVSAQPRTTSSAVAPAAGDRLVRFNVNPKGALLEVDGFSVDHITAVIPLAPGRHSAKLTPQLGDKSFEVTSSSFTVEPRAAGENEASVQKIQLGTSFKNARVSLLAPAGGQAVCGAINLAAGSNSIVMRNAVYEGKCQFLAPGRDAKSAFVTIKAGEDNVVPWPSGS